MKKGIRIVGIAIICIGIIVGYYYYLSNHGKKDVENSTEISKVDEALSRDLAKDYPPTPREVVKFYYKLLQCFYNEDCSKSEIAELGGQARLLMDDALLANNPKEQYLTLLENDIQDSKDKGKTISDTTVANSSDIKYQKVKGEECAYVTASYFVKEGNSYTRTYEEYVLRKDTNKQWKILGYQLTKGDSSDEQ